MSTKLNLKRSLFAGLPAGIAAAIINAGLFIAFHSAGVISDEIYPQPEQPLTLLPVIMSLILPLIIGSVLFYLFDGFTDNGFKIFAALRYFIRRTKQTN